MTATIRKQAERQRRKERGEALTEKNVETLKPGDTILTRSGLELTYVYTEKNGWLFCDGFDGKYPRDAVHWEGCSVEKSE